MGAHCAVPPTPPRTLKRVEELHSHRLLEHVLACDPLVVERRPASPQSVSALVRVRTNAPVATTQRHRPHPMRSRAHETLPPPEPEHSTAKRPHLALDAGAVSSLCSRTARYWHDLHCSVRGSSSLA